MYFGFQIHFLKKPVFINLVNPIVLINSKFGFKIIEISAFDLKNLYSYLPCDPDSTIFIKKIKKTMDQDGNILNSIPTEVKVMIRMKILGYKEKDRASPMMAIEELKIK